MGTFGMSYSLQSRDLIADSVETAAAGHWLDGMVTIPVCQTGPPSLSSRSASQTSRGDAGEQIDQKLEGEQTLIQFSPLPHRLATRTCPVS